MIPSPNHSSRQGKTIRLIVVHTAEGSTNTTSLGNYFAKSASQASSHVGIDDAAIEQYVSYDQAAWTLRSGNAISDNAELCAFAAMKRDQWLSPDTVTFYHPALKRNVTVNHPRQILDLTAKWIAERAATRQIPINKLTASQVAAGHAGVIGHWDWTMGMKDGSHTDPGTEFPWDYVIDKARGPVAAPTTYYCKLGENNAKVMTLQKFMTSHFASYNTYTPTGFYGDATKSGLAEFQRRVGITGPDADGSIVGPRTLAKLTEQNFRP